jgi:Protein of unknown function N-terminus (DUF3323)
MRVDIRAIDAVMQRADIVTSLCEALEQLDDPIVHAATARAKLEVVWSNIVDGCHHPHLAEFLRTPAGSGLLKRLSNRVPGGASQPHCRVEAALQLLPPMA